VPEPPRPNENNSGSGFSFTTGNFKKMTIKQANLDEAAKIFSEPELSAFSAHPEPSNALPQIEKTHTRNPGFSFTTGQGRNLIINQKNLQKAESLFNGIEDEAPQPQAQSPKGQPGFTFTTGNQLQLKPKQDNLNKAMKIFDEGPGDQGSSGFTNQNNPNNIKFDFDNGFSYNKPNPDGISKDIEVG
jgi:hypothetical protein